MIVIENRTLVLFGIQTSGRNLRLCTGSRAGYRES